MFNYSKVLPFVLVLGAIQDAQYSTSSGSPASCTPTTLPHTSPVSDTPNALLENSSSPDSNTLDTNQYDASPPSPSPSPSCGFIELLIMLISHLAFFAHQLATTPPILEMENLHITMALVKEEIDSVDDRSRYHERKLAHETRELASLVAGQQRQIDTLAKQLHEERELSKDIKKNLETLSSRISRGDHELDVFHGRLHDQLASQVKDQSRTESDVADLRKDIPKALSLYHTRISALEFALSQAKPPASPEDVVCDSKPLTICRSNTAPKTQRSGISISATSLRFIDRESIYIDKSASARSKAAGVPAKPTSPKTPTAVDSVRRPVTVKSSVSRVLPSSKIAIPSTRMSSAPKAGVSKTPTTVDSVRRPVTVKSSVSRVLPSSKIAIPSTRMSSAPKAGVSKTPTTVDSVRRPVTVKSLVSRVLKTPASKDTPSNIPARRESATLKKSASAAKGKMPEPRAPLKKSGSAAVKGKVLKLRNNQVLAPSSSPVAPATTSHTTDSTSRPSETLQGVAGQPMSSSSSLEALDAAVQLHSLGDLRDSLPSLHSMSWLDGTLDGVAGQQFLSSSSLEALDAAVQLHSLGDLRDPLPSLDSMSWLDECRRIAGRPLCPSSSMEALDAAVQPSSLDDLCGLLPSLDSMSFLDDDAIPVPPFKSLGQNKARSIKCYGVANQSLCPSSSMKALDTAVQLSSLDDLRGTMPSLDSASFLDDDTLSVPPFKSLGRNKA
ncbi:hypothetical protein DFH29DRAFT_881765 [Suillus ampliporus]|nr:hypothetical protein DFH29DRAFT_881765 [Suillus ampliporus]